jgi:hypothetical protein
LLSLGKAKNVFFPSFAGRIKKLHPQAEKEDGRRRLHRPRRFNVSLLSLGFYIMILLRSAQGQFSSRKVQRAHPGALCKTQDKQSASRVDCWRRQPPSQFFFSPGAFRVCGRKHKHIHIRRACGYGRVCMRDDNNTLSFSLAPSSYSHMERFWLFPLFGVVMLLRALPAHKYA